MYNLFSPEKHLLQEMFLLVFVTNLENICVVVKTVLLTPVIFKTSIPTWM